MGNLASVKNAFDYLSIPCEIFSDPSAIPNYDRLLLPGVGAFGKAMENLHASGFEDAIKKAVLINEVPILGICLGMQLLLSNSTEHGSHSGLDIVKGTVTSFKEVVTGMPVPHMGWNDVTLKNSALGNADGSKGTYYFVHSFYCSLEEENYVTGFTEYGIRFHSMFEKDHISGCQFHPEKSQADGLTIFKNFGSKEYA